jgi:hypothetical protein
MIVKIQRGKEVEEIKLDVERDFSIEETQLSKNMSLSGGLLARYAELAADLRAEVARKEAELKFFDSNLELKIRSKASEDNMKLTESGVNAIKTSNPDRFKLVTDLIESESNRDKLENLFRALLKKVDLVIALAYKQRAEVQKSGW